jgi:hypothetical protein
VRPKHGHESAHTALRRSSRAPWVILGLAILAALGALALRLMREEAPPPPSAGPSAPAAAPAPAAPPAPPPETARALVEAISANPLFRKATADDFANRAALVLSALVNGESPRKPLAMLAPKAPFTVDTRGDKTVIAAASYARYDAFADAVSSVDAQKAAAAYQALRGPLETALHALGYPDARLDDFTARALRRVAAAPVLEGDVELVGRKGFFAFADPKLEQAAEVEKHILRMGPRNTKLLQAKARELLGALGLPATER